jgi:hypothetical protein
MIMYGGMEVSSVYSCLGYFTSIEGALELHGKEVGWAPEPIWQL